MRFSQRIGKRPIKTIFQTDEIDKDLKNRLWNIFFQKLERIDFNEIGSSPRLWFYNNFWKNFLNLPLDEIPRNSWNVDDSLTKIYLKQWFYKAPWYDIYDFFEYLLKTGDYQFGRSFIDEVNEILRLEVSS